MTEPYLSMPEIEARYPNEWVLIDRPKTDRHQQVLGGHVLAHSGDKTAVYERAKQLPAPVDIALLYTGEVLEDVIFLL